MPHNIPTRKVPTLDIAAIWVGTALRDVNFSKTDTGIISGIDLGSVSGRSSGSVSGINSGSVSGIDSGLVSGLDSGTVSESERMEVISATKKNLY